jgi:hypothetical protein
MRYTTFRAGPWPKAGRIAKVLSRALPRANPDFESAYENAVSWWLELDEKKVVRRELAFDASGIPVAAAPLGRNYGIFTDLDSAPDGLGADVDASRFEETWRQFERSWLAANSGHRAV